MKVLVLSPQKRDKESRRRRLLIVRTLEDLKLSLLNPAPGRPPEKKIFRPSLFPQIFYQGEVTLFEKADFIIADLTDPDFRTGFLISKALDQGKIVLGLYWEAIPNQSMADWQGDKPLYIECFNQQNIRSLMRQFLKFFKQKTKRRGKLVVIDGTDGSGKATQSKLLVDYLNKKGVKTKYIDFPRYYSSFHGGMVGRYLKGEFGGLGEVDPYLASLLYALDRLTAKNELDDWLKNGNFVVSNRYTSSNMAFQSMRVDKSKRKEFLNWLTNMEYKIHKLPKEDLVVFLHVPAEIGQKLVDKKGKRGYTGKKRDIHEENLVFLKKVEKMYLSLVRKFDHWVKIDCIDKKGKLMSIEEIHKKIIQLLERKKLVV